MLEPIGDAISIIRKRPQMYVPGCRTCLGEALSSDLAFDAVIGQASPVVIDKVGRWWLIGSPIDWLVNAGHPVGHLFTHHIATPHVGDNTMRHEVLVAALAKGVAVFRGGTIEWSYGDVNERADLEKTVSTSMSGWRVVAFVL